MTKFAQCLKNFVTFVSFVFRKRFLQWSHVWFLKSALKKGSRKAAKTQKRSKTWRSWRLARRQDMASENQINYKEQ